MLRTRLYYEKERFFRLIASRMPLLPPIRFAVISRGRSGSNLLMYLLQSHPRMSVRGEIVGEAILGEAALKKGIVNHGPVSYLNKRFQRTGFESAVGVKFLYYQLEKPYADKFSVPGLADLEQYLNSQQDMKFIHLKRRNYLKTLVSIRVAAKTKVYVVKKQKQPVETTRIHLTSEECLEEFTQIRKWEEHFDHVFGDRTLEAFYEDLVKNREAECNRVLDFLNVDRQPLTSPMKKQQKASLSETVVNFDELKVHFADTEWAWFFDG